MQYSFFDVHAHLHDKAFDEDRDTVIEQMAARAIGAITVGTGLHESRQAVALADKYPHIFATVGQHPCDNIFEGYDEEVYKELGSHDKVVAIGECGLDYHYIDSFFDRDMKDKPLVWNKEQEKERQKELFQKQIELAVYLNKPLMLHGRPTKNSMDAYEDMLELLEASKRKCGDALRGNAHFFVGNIDIAERFMNIEFTVSFSGVVTFAKDYDDAVRFVPQHMIFGETDSPYATPAPYRGERNSPLFVQEVVARISVLRQEPLEELRMEMLASAKRLFGV